MMLTFRHGTRADRSWIIAWVIFAISVGARSQALNFQIPLDPGDDSPQCNIDCSKAIRESLCGSDGRTYDSQCELEKANCEGYPVRLKHTGPCPESKRCTMERSHAQEMAQRPAAGIFIPECNRDGSYAGVQCHAGTGYCWCVNSQGRPIPGSSARFERPNCAHYRNANSHKRSARGRKARRSCGIEDRRLFNVNLVQIFGSEYNRTLDSRIASLFGTLEMRIVAWKFTQLDLDMDRQLNKTELRDLRRMVKKIIQPRPCARTFTQYCDLDQNKNITKDEWITCLGVNEIGLRSTSTTKKPAHGAFTAVGNSEDLLGTPAPVPTPATPAGLDELMRMFFRPPKGDRSVSQWKDKFGEMDLGASLLSEAAPTNATQKKRDPTKKKRPNCVAERSKALSKQRRDPSAGTYVPDCDTNGHYAKIQCHSATGFCWCVNPENGKPIPQTSTLGTQPNCNLVSFRPLRGCPGQRKENFLKNLTTVLTKEMTEFVSANGSTKPFTYSKDDVFRWKFQRLDRNTNGVLERGEWKPFKESLTADENLVKCGKGYLRYCDVDDNKHLTVDEWLQCSTPPSANEKRKVPLHHKRRGENPLTKYLKAD